MKKLKFVLSAYIPRAKRAAQQALCGVCLVLGAGVAGAAVLDKAYLSADRPAAGEAAISRSEALVFRSGGDPIYGQLLRPNAAVRVRKDYPTSHGFMGVRVAFAADIADFIRTVAERE